MAEVFMVMIVCGFIIFYFITLYMYISSLTLPTVITV